jgi:carboxypeptidase family protein/TonB-dependent receptor-like protein
MRTLGRAVLIAIGVLAASSVSAQVQTGSITGTVADSSGAVLPGASVSLTGDKLIGGVQTQTTDVSGTYRFDRLPPGDYRVKFELQGFKTVDRADIKISAAFVATVNAKLEVGSVSETVTVTGESPTIDTKSNLQQTVMNQEILEGIPSGRDPWSVAKVIPGVQVSTYDVGGTQSYQQSSLSAHGSSTNDVNYNIDGASVNWPGGGGGATMLYYDQGMFEEVNYMTSAIPAEVMVGGVSINMVTKDAGNKWRGDARYNYSSGCLTPQSPAPGCLESDNVQSGIAAGTLPTTFLGNPTQTTYDFNLAGGGALVRDRLWVNGSVRRWVVNKLVNAKNIDKTQAIDDNTMRNFSGKAVFSIDRNQKLSFAYNWDNKIRGHRRDTPPDNVPDIASLVQRNPASSTQAKYTGIRNKTVFESSFSVMSGQTSYLYQPGTPATAVRVQDASANTADFAAQRHEENPNSRIQFDNTVSMTKSGWGGDHLFKGGVQFARMYFDDFNDVLNSMYLLYNNGKPTSVREYNTPTDALNIDKVFGLFFQDSWSAGNRLTINLGARFDHNVGTLPAQSIQDGLFIGARSLPETSPIKQNIAVWRTGLVFDPTGDGRTALKASYSRYGLQVGIDRVLNVNPFQSDFQTCTWLDPNNDGIAQTSEISACGGFAGLTSHYASPTGPRWPYSDEVTAGVERQLMKDMRVGAMYYHRTNRDQIGTRNLAVPTSAYSPVTVNVPNGPNGPTTAVVYNLSPAFFGGAFQNNVVDNQPYLDTTYDGVELTASKRFSHHWQMVTGLTIGKNKGGLNFSPSSGAASGQSATNDLNDPNNTLFSNGIVGNDSKVAFRLSGSYQAPGAITIAGSLISNNGFPVVSTFTVPKALSGSVTRATQSVLLSARGDERLPNVTLVDIRVSRAFAFGQGRRIMPTFDLYNVGNSAAIVSLTSAVGPTYRNATAIVSPRIARIGLSINF